MREYKYAAPATFEELFELFKNTEGIEVKVVAGGTDFIPRLSQEVNSIPTEEKKPLQIIYLGKLGLDRIVAEGPTISIGALCTLDDIQKHPIIKEKLPVIADTISKISGMAVRSIATLGGNIMNASPAADSVPTLIALDAKFVLKSEKGVREIDAKNFFVGPGRTEAEKDEILIAIKIETDNGRAAFVKLGRRKAETLSVANAAVNIVVSDGLCKKVNIAVGSVGPTVIKCKMAEEALLGKKLTIEAIKEASKKIAEEISPINDIRGTIWYREKVTPVLVERALKKAADL